LRPLEFIGQSVNEWRGKTLWTHKGEDPLSLPFDERLSFARAGAGVVGEIEGVVEVDLRTVCEAFPPVAGFSGDRSTPGVLRFEAGEKDHDASLDEYPPAP